jgi:hypothetical protein
LHRIITAVLNSHIEHPHPATYVKQYPHILQIHTTPKRIDICAHNGGALVLYIVICLPLPVAMKSLLKNKVAACCFEQRFFVNNNIVVPAEPLCASSAIM